MILQVYAMFDRMSQTYGEPFCAVNDNVAQRRFQYVCANSPMVAQDMQLFKLGTYNTDNGQLGADIVFVANFVLDVKD